MLALKEIGLSFDGIEAGGTQCWVGRRAWDAGGQPTVVRGSEGVSGPMPCDGRRRMWVVVFCKNRLKDSPKCLFRLLWLGELLSP